MIWCKTYGAKAMVRMQRCYDTNALQTHATLMNHILLHQWLHCWYESATRRRIQMWDKGQDGEVSTVFVTWDEGCNHCNMYCKNQGDIGTIRERNKIKCFSSRVSDLPGADLFRLLEIWIQFASKVVTCISLMICILWIKDNGAQKAEICKNGLRRPGIGKV